MGILSQEYDVADSRAKEVDAQAKISEYARVWLHHWHIMMMVFVSINYLPLPYVRKVNKYV